jgi:hypothetical protein
MKIVNWSFITSHDWFKDHAEEILPLMDADYHPYTSLIKDITKTRKGVVYLKCPANTDFLKNTFVFRAPFDLTIDIEVSDNDRDPNRIWCPNINQAVFDKLIDTRFLYNDARGIDPYPLIGLDWLNQFTCKESMMLQVMPAFLHRNEFTEKATMIPGEYDISKWTRPVELVFEVKSNRETIVIRKGDALAYFKFRCDEAVKLEEQPTPWDEIYLCDQIKMKNRFRPLKERYAQLSEARANGCPYDHNS